MDDNIYIYIYKSVLSHVNLELETIPSKTIKLFNNRISNLSNSVRAQCSKLLKKQQQSLRQDIGLNIWINMSKFC